MNSKRRKEAPALDYRLDVRDFGPIARASVEMRPLTVFIGPSNTGKSYLAMLLYVLHRCLCLETGGVWQDHPLRRRMYFGNAVSQRARQDAKKVREALMGWIAAALTNDSPPPLSDELLKRIHSDLEQANSLAFALDEELRRCFGVGDLRTLARRGSGKKPTVAVIGPPEARPPSAESDAEVARYEFKLAEVVDLAGNMSLDVLSKSLMEYVETERSFVELDDLSDELRASFYLSRTLGQAIDRFLGAARRQAHYLPADRTGVMHSHQVVVGALVQSAPMAGIRPTATMPTLSGVLADFLHQLINMPGHSQRNGLAKRFEDSLLAGAVRMATSDANYPSFLYRPSGWEEDLPLMRTSSMVSELAPVVLYLRYVVQPGDVLIVEEPEAHLHPAMQAKFARELARLVRAGVRIVLTTHSEWLLEQIGNLVRLSALPKRRRVGIEGADVALEPSQVGAWLFKPSQRPRGSIVQEVKPDPQTGLFPTDFDDVSMALYNDGSEIFNRLQEEQGR